MAQKFVDNKIKENKVAVFSKSYCPFCNMAKTSLDALIKGKYFLVELDEKSDAECNDIQDYLQSLTGARSVPRVFINGKCIGGGSETKALADSGQLKTMLNELGLL